MEKSTQPCKTPCVTVFSLCVLALFHAPGLAQTLVQDWSPPRALSQWVATQDSVNGNCSGKIWQWSAEALRNYVANSPASSRTHSTGKDQPKVRPIPIKNGRAKQLGKVTPSYVGIRVQALKRAPFRSERIALIQTFAPTDSLALDEVSQLLDALDYEEEKMEALSVLLPQLPPGLHCGELIPHFQTRALKKEVCALIRMHRTSPSGPRVSAFP